MATNIEPAPSRQSHESKRLPTFHMSHHEHDGQSTNSKTSDASQNLPRDESSGLLSSLITAAHSAANMMKSKHSASTESLGKISESKGPESQKEGQSGLAPHHSSNSGHSSDVTSSQSARGSLGNDSSSTSNVHFEPVHSSPIHTLGAGDLSLNHFERNRPAHKNVSDSAEVSVKGGPFMTETNTNKLLVSGTQDSKVVRRKSISNGSIADSLSSENTIDTDGADNHTFNPSEFSTSELDQILDSPNKLHVHPKKDREFHSTFKKIPTNEYLLADFSCALSRDILVQGKMYLSPNYICFKSNILGWVTNLVIPIQEIIQIEKKSTAVLFPNGMVIRTLHQKFVFATFLSRDTTFNMITRVWHNALQDGESGDVRTRKGAKKSRSRRSTVGDSDITDDVDSDDLLSGSEEDVDSVHSSDDNDLTFMSRSSEKSKGQEAKKPQDDDDTPESGSDSGDDDASIDDSNESPSKDKKNGALFKGFTNPGPQSHGPTSFDHEKMDNEVEIITHNFSAPVGVIYNMLYGPDNSTFIRILEEGKNFDISKEKITEINERHKEREYSYTKPLSGPIGPKQTKCNLTETLVKQDFSAFCALEQVTKTPDVPSGNSFKVKTVMYFSWGPKNSTDMTVYTAVEWSAKSWIKSAVEKGSLDGQKSSMKILTETITDLLNSGGSGASKKKRKRSKSDNKPAKASEPSQKEAEPVSLSSQILQLLDQVGSAIPVQIPFVSSAVTGGIVLFLASLMYSYILTFFTGGRSSSNLPYQSDGRYISMPVSELYIRDEELRRQNEAQLWEWIRTRTGENRPYSERRIPLKREYSDENFKEMMRMTKERIDAAYSNLL